MNYAEIKNLDVANGLGIRVSLFVSGCRNHCKGCFNYMTWDFDYGEPFTEEVEEKILSLLAPGHITGLSLLGGEPFEEEYYEEAIKEVVNAMEKYDPSLIGAKWNEKEPRIQLEPRGERGYIEMKAIKKA